MTLRGLDDWIQRERVDLAEEDESICPKCEGHTDDKGYCECKDNLRPMTAEEAFDDIAERGADDWEKDDER